MLEGRRFNDQLLVVLVGQDHVVVLPLRVPRADVFHAPEFEDHPVAQDRVTRTVDVRTPVHRDRDGLARAQGRRAVVGHDEGHEVRLGPRLALMGRPAEFAHRRVEGRAFGQARRTETQALARVYVRR